MNNEEYVKFAEACWEANKIPNEIAMDKACHDNPLPPVVAAMPEVAKLLAATNKMAFYLGCTAAAVALVNLIDNALKSEGVEAATIQ